jgi:hypothetical protein
VQSLEFKPQYQSQRERDREREKKERIKKKREKEIFCILHDPTMVNTLSCYICWNP